MNRPNLLLIFPDQMRGSAMGFLGEEPVHTPNLDRMASQGLVLDQACATYPVCSPYRAMLMTGKYPLSNGVVANCTSSTADRGVELNEQDRCWSDVLRDKDYSLGYIGKWHLDSPREPYVDSANNRGTVKWNEWCPPGRRHGFDYWYAYGTYDDHLKPMYWRTDAGRDRFHYVDQWGPEHEADMAIRYLRNEDGAYRKSDQPFGLVVSMNPPHMPYDKVPARYLEAYAGFTDEQLCTRANIPPKGARWGDYYRENIRQYFAMITGVDAQVGRILQALEDSGQSDDTIVVFTSDHGNCLGIHDEISKNNAFEESLRVPFIIRWPGRIQPRRDDLLISAPDLHPTLLDLCGFAPDIPEAVEGTSYAGALRGGAQDRPTSQFCMRDAVETGDIGWRALRTHRHTLVVTRRLGQAQQTALYDRENDPCQLHNHAADRPQVVQRLSDQLDAWLQRLNDPWLTR